MADATLDTVAEIAVAANDQFTARHAGAATSAGVISSTIRAMGIEADAVNIDCEHSGKRLVLILLDNNPGKVGIGIGQKDTIGEYQLITYKPVDELAIADILEILEARFSLTPP